MRTRHLAAIAAAALLAAACGGEEAPPEGQPPESPAETTPAEGVDLSGETLEVAAVWSGAEQENFERVLAAFEERTGAEVQFTSTGDDINAFLGPRIEGGQPPDVAILPQPGLLRSLAEQGVLVDIGPTVGPLVDQHYAPVWRDLGSVDGTLYGVWFKAANKSTVWFNVNVFNDAGVTPPTTWEEWITAAQTLQAFGVAPISVGGADGWTLTDWFENVYLRTAGADAYDQLTAHAIPWTDQTVKDALATLGELLGNPDFLAGGREGALQTDFPTSVVQVFADPPAAAIVYEGDFVAGVITAETDAVLGQDADFFAFPAIDGSPPAVVGGGDVAVALTDRPATIELLKFLATPEAAEIWAAQGGFTSPNKDVDLSVYPDEITRKSAEQLTSAETFRFDLSDLQPSEFGGTVGQGLFKLFQDWLADPDDIDGITAQMEEAAAAAFGS